LSSSAKKLIVGLSSFAALALPACGVVQTHGPSLQDRLTDELTVKRGFTNIDFESVEEVGQQFARALVSVGGCRLQLAWAEGDSWKLVDDSAINGLTGELTAAQITSSDQYKNCAKQPAPSAPPKPTP
jgi:hypothetical protein